MWDGGCGVGMVLGAFQLLPLVAPIFQNVYKRPPPYPLTEPLYDDTSRLRLAVARGTFGEVHFPLQYTPRVLPVLPGIFWGKMGGNFALPPTPSLSDNGPITTTAPH